MVVWLTNPGYIGHMPLNLFTAPSYQFTYDKLERLLLLELKGVWDISTLDRFIDEMSNLAASVRLATPNDRRGRILIDLSSFPVQQADIIEALAHLLPALGDRAGRVALVKSKSAPQNRQNQRLLGGPDVRMVDTATDGLVWLRRDSLP